jgi:nicotinamidase/pyrazinamidase
MNVLLIVDVQKDFCPGGALPAEGGDRVVPVINDLMDRFDRVIASKDWHPDQTVHFDKWPRHCVKNTEGAEFHEDLKLQYLDLVLLKGTGNQDDGYSAFEATNVDLNAYLKINAVDTLFVCGLTTDYCVEQTALDAARKGFPTVVLTDAIKAVNQKPGDGERSLEKMRKAGCRLVTSRQVKEQLPEA